MGNTIDSLKTQHNRHTVPTVTHTPVLHACVFPRRLFEWDVAWSEGAEAASNDGNGPELCPGLVHHVGAGGTLLAVVPIAPLQVVVGTGDGHLHGCPSVKGAESEMQRKTTEGTGGMETESSREAWSLKQSVSLFSLILLLFFKLFIYESKERHKSLSSVSCSHIKSIVRLS